MGKFKDGIKRYWLPSAVWVAVVTYVVWAVCVSRTSYSETTVSRIDVEIVDSTADRRLVTGSMVRDWIAKSGIAVNGMPVEEVDLQGIERAVADNGFVGKVSAYTSADGVLRIEVRQRTPLLRLLTDGYNRYVTADGFVFSTPASSAIYVPVVTGSFRPQFGVGFEGSSRSWCDSLIEGSQGIVKNIGRLRENRSRIVIQNTEINERIKDLERDIRKYGDSEDRARLRRKQDSVRRNRMDMARIDEQIDNERRRIKKTREEYEDFRKLLTFVERLESDDFWRSEIVQIIADRRPSGTLELQFVPRSGSFIIEFGEIADVDMKLDKMMKFYRDGLNNRGWDEYSVVSVAYRGQVVCRKR